MELRDLLRTGAEFPELGQREDPGEPVVAERRVIEVHLGDARDAGKTLRHACREDPGGVLGDHGPVFVKLDVAHPAARGARLEHDSGYPGRAKAIRRHSRVAGHGGGQVLVTGAEQPRRAHSPFQPDLRARNPQADPDLGTFGHQLEDGGEVVRDVAALPVSAVVPHGFPEQATGDGDPDRGSRPPGSGHAPSPQRFRAVANTSWNMGRVSRPVKVFCWLGW